MTLSPTVGALALYKRQPVMVCSVNQKITILLSTGEKKEVRPKDIFLLHAGPIKSLAEVKRLEVSDLEEVLLLLEEEESLDASLCCDLLFNEDSPSALFSLQQMLEEEVYLKGKLNDLHVVSAEERNERVLAKEQAKKREEHWKEFIQALQKGKWREEDRHLFSELEQFVAGKSRRSKILDALNQRQLPEVGYKLLLKCAIWDKTVNPYLVGNELNSEPEKIDGLALPEETRVDLTHLKSYAIDDPQTTDPDDALALEGEKIWIHIADVAAIATPNSPLDKLAQKRISSIYLPEKTIHMLPREVVSLLGLGLNETSPALSFGVTINDDGAIKSVEVLKSWVKVTRLNYVDLCRDFDQYPDLDSLYKITRRFCEFRKNNGSKTIQMPDYRTKVEEGVVQITPIEELFTRDLVAETMLIAGCAVAFFAKENHIPIPYVTQPVPQIPFEIKDTLSSQYAARYYFKRSQMSLMRASHGGLGLPFYTRVTSPLRRYCDLVVMQQLRLFLAGEPLFSQDELVTKMGLYDAFIGEIIRLQRRSEKHWKFVYLLQQKEPFRSEGTLISYDEGKGCTFFLDEIGLELSLPYHKGLTLDNRYLLELQEIQLENQEIFFSLADEETP